MANTYSQLIIHLVIAVRNRESLLIEKHRSEIFKYISGILFQRGHKPIIVNGVADHVHILFGLNPTEAISDLTREIKKSVSSFINNKKYLHGKFYWQEGYGAFSYSKSQLDTLYNYILKQEEQHKRSSFRTEYLEILDEFGIEYNPEYLFDFTIR